MLVCLECDNRVVSLGLENDGVGLIKDGPTKRDENSIGLFKV